MAPILAISCAENTDTALAALRDRFLAQGRPITGVLQGRGPAAGGKDAMLVHEVTGRFTRVISQNLGASASGCRLDPGALEDVVQQVAETLDGAEWLFVNRFGKQEELGRGFAPVIARAVEAGIGVLVAVAPEKRGVFEDFAGGMARWVSAEDIALECA